MKRWQRKALNRLADALAHVAEDLRSAARRPARVQPLRFPTASELMMQEIVQRQIKAYGAEVMRSLMKPNALLKVRLDPDETMKVGRFSLTNRAKHPMFVSPSPYAD